MAKRRWQYIAAVVIVASGASAAPAQWTPPPVMPPLIVRPPESMPEPMPEPEAAPRTPSFRERVRQTAIGQFWRSMWSRPTPRPTGPRPAVREIRPTSTEEASTSCAGHDELARWVNQPVTTIEPEVATTSEADLTRWAEAVGSEAASAGASVETAAAEAKTLERPPVRYLGHVVVRPRP